MRPYLLSTFLMALVVLGTASAAATSESKAHEHDHLVDALMRPIHLISVASEDENASDHQRASLSYALSADLNDSAAPSQVHELDRPAVLCVRGCGASMLGVAAGYEGTDFEVESVDAYDGVLHIAWSSTSGNPFYVCCGAVGQVSIGLTVGGESYGTVTYPLRSPSGDARIPLQFQRAPSCDQAPNETGHSCAGDSGQEADSNESMPALHASDFSLQIMLRVASDTLRDPLGGRVSIKVDTGGGSMLHVREVPPPPPEVPAAEASGDAQELAISYQDTDGDGVLDPEELHFVPGPSILGVLAALCCIGLVRRRFRG